MPAPETVDDADLPEFSSRPLVAGVGAAVAGSIVLLVGYFFACPPLSHSGCGALAMTTLAWLAGAMLALSGAYAFARPGGVRFAGAFCLTIIVGAMATRGMLFQVWTAPVRSAFNATRPLWTPAFARREQWNRNAQWVATTAAQTLEGIHGVRLARELAECIELQRDADSSQSYPRAPDAVTAGASCAALVSDRIDLPGGPTRYTLAGDPGYRWSYVAGAPDDAGRVFRYSIRVEPDSLLRKPGPVYLSDETGLLMERVRAGDQASVVASPVQFLSDIRPCVAQLQAERRRRAARTDHWYSAPSAFDAAASTCPDIASRLRERSRPDSATVAVPIHERRGEFLDTAGVYLVTYIPLDAEGWMFLLRATPQTGSRYRAGVRRYLVAADGSLHVTSEQRDATPDDPAPPACEIDPPAPCAR